MILRRRQQTRRKGGTQKGAVGRVRGGAMSDGAVENTNASRLESVERVAKWVQNGCMQSASHGLKAPSGNLASLPGACCMAPTLSGLPVTI